ncbi:Protein N-acetyltransferase, RimJ/RimL family [Gemmobacter megaterium]|uniref:Protein N-acetyltransferase, RimJ/RimL family n=1 Tax=Gemmobacter megaterium TaxID=1086013 RepID=A0A1N7PQZ3_9RHOB|nr:GNAT family N-acetyltransferase [Gemmobacter megaterium]GGE20727.1 GNAT family acetyltransferase [Gemmobacter megaterium]SIT12965.1 Protein N-acetyltransferase, RimJ/RimL family [Gemmobacter megaterium]
MIHLSGTPVLETERLILRAPQASDFEAFAQFFVTDRARHVGGPVERPQAWRAFGHLIGHWVMRGYGFFVFADRTSGLPLGSAGPWCPDGWPEPEIGWTVWAPEAEGKGMAHEAALAARAWAYGQLGWETAISLIAAENARSQALARRMGAVPERDADVMGKPCVIWRHPSADALTDGGMEAYA